MQFVTELQPVYSLALYQPNAAFDASPLHSAASGATAIFFVNGTFRLYELPEHLGQHYSYIDTALWAGTNPDAAVVAVAASEQAARDGLRLEGFVATEVAPPPQLPVPPLDGVPEVTEPGFQARPRAAPVSVDPDVPVEGPGVAAEPPPEVPASGDSDSAARIWQPLVVVFSLSAPAPALSAVCSCFATLRLPHGDPSSSTSNGTLPSARGYMRVQWRVAGGRSSSTSAHSMRSAEHVWC